MKRCGRCKEKLALEAFGKLKRTRDGLRWECRKCAAKANSERRKDPAVQEAERRRKATPAYREVKRRREATPAYREVKRRRNANSYANNREARLRRQADYYERRGRLLVLKRFRAHRVKLDATLTRLALIPDARSRGCAAFQALSEAKDGYGFDGMYVAMSTIIEVSQLLQIQR